MKTERELHSRAATDAVWQSHFPNPRNRQRARNREIAKSQNRKIAKMRICEIAMKLWEESFYTPKGEAAEMKLGRARNREIKKSRNREIKKPRG